METGLTTWLSSRSYLSWVIHTALHVHLSWDYILEVFPRSFFWSFQRFYSEAKCSVLTHHIPSTDSWGWKAFLIHCHNSTMKTTHSSLGLLSGFTLGALTQEEHEGSVRRIHRRTCLLSSKGVLLEERCRVPTEKDVWKRSLWSRAWTCHSPRPWTCVCSSLLQEANTVVWWDGCLPYVLCRRQVVLLGRQVQVNPGLLTRFIHRRYQAA